MTRAKRAAELSASGAVVHEGRRAGNASAQFALGTKYFLGQGVSENYVLAHLWLNLAASKNNEYAKDRDAIVTFMTPTQLAEARKLAREWKPTTGTQAPSGEANYSSDAPDRSQYERVLTLFRDGDLDGARHGFTAFIAGYPGSALAPNAWFWLGESYYGMKNYEKAVEAYDRVELDYPTSDKVPAAILKKGYSYIALKDRKKAAATLKRLAATFPDSVEAERALNKLAQLAGVSDRAPAKIEDAGRSNTKSYGTGFVSRQGHVLTNYT